MQTSITNTKKAFVSRVPIEERRRNYSLRVSEGIREKKAMIKMHEKTIENFESHGGPDVDYTAQRIQKCKGQIDELIGMIAEQERLLTDIACGGQDNAILQEISASRDNTQKRREEAHRKRITDLERDTATHSEGNTFFMSEKSEQSKERAMEREYNKFLSAVETLPPHIARNIETTPCNRAYRWRGVLFYGKLPEEQPDMIFEKQRDGTIIKEITPTSETVYFKDGTTKKKTTVASFRRNVDPRLSRPAIVSRR